MSVTSSVDCLPRELVQLITSRLRLSDHRSLCGTSSSFGQQPCREFITRLTLTLPDLKQCRVQQQRRQHQQQLQRGAAWHGWPHVQALTIKGPQNDTPTAASSQESHCQTQLVLFFALVVPTMACLTKLTLSGMLLSSVASAAACLAAACPQLAHIVLQAICVDPDQMDLRLSDVWPSLAGVRSLRCLKLVAGSSGPPLEALEAYGAGLPGVGAITQLQRLSMNSLQLQLSELSQLVCLSKLSVWTVAADPAPGADVAPPPLGHLTRLQHLHAFGFAGDTSPLAACPSLAGLHVQQDDLSRLLPAHTGLVRLDARNTIVTAAELQALPVLRELRCQAVHMPRAGSGIALPAVEILKSKFFGAPLSDNDDDDDVTAPPLAAQSVAVTFPRLAALKWACAHEDNAPAGELWPTSWPAGRLPHLRTFSVVCLHLSPHFAQCAAAVQDLVVKAAKSDDDGPTTVIEFLALLPPLLLLGPHLRRLELRDTAIIDEQLIHLAGSWPLMEEVMLRGVRADLGSVTDGGLLALLRLPRLRRVTLSRCSAVTPSAISALATRWCVERIEVCGCALVGAADVLRILRQLGRPQLDIVHSSVGKEVVRWRKGLTL